MLERILKAAPKGFYKSLYTEAKQRVLQSRRDPEVYRAALAEAMEAEGVLADFPPEHIEAFRQGFDHRQPARPSKTYSSF